ncbi:cell division protein ZapE [Gallaecimonas mangrovi]|uniref:cell division protein ZapE n=1 Tax=Gallaecimonas mangrovi TaxID=2291597 RepID=UPI000E1FC14B|nr:cell division protein ZapE [Gallaecimonas mangrovi]
MKLSLKKPYFDFCQRQDFVADPAQLAAIDAFDALLKKLDKKKATANGLYLWGDVGRGKTMLMDLFFQILPEPRKRRLHFNHFMKWLYGEMKAEANRPDALAYIAKSLRQRCRVLCFDEFFITDIGDAMLIQRLLHFLFAEGVVLVITSNKAPGELFQNHFQRDRFAPGIALIKQHCQVLHLDGQQDHRQRPLDSVQTCFCHGEQDFAALFAKLAPAPSMEALTLGGQPLASLGHGAKIGWFSFEALCNQPFSAQDYIELANRFEVLLISQVPYLGGSARDWLKSQGPAFTEPFPAWPHHALGDDPARRLLNLVDECYDRRLTLYLETLAPLNELYRGGVLAFEYQRTLSRLTEMQSAQYLRQ